MPDHPTPEALRARMDALPALPTNAYTAQWANWMLEAQDAYEWALGERDEWEDTARGESDRAEDMQRERDEARTERDHTQYAYELERAEVERLHGMIGELADHLWSFEWPVAAEGSATDVAIAVITAYRAEVERLRGEWDELFSDFTTNTKRAVDAEAEVERLRAALRVVAGYHPAGKCDEVRDFARRALDGES